MSKSVSSLFCLIRHTWVAAQPEEQIRQRLLHQLIYQLGYPIGSVGVEKSLRQMPHLQASAMRYPDRRADIICFYKEHPLLLIECKAVPLDEKVLRQVIGYNLFVKAQFIAVANQETVSFGWYDASIKDFRFISFIPPYIQVVSQAFSAVSL